MSALVRGRRRAGGCPRGCPLFMNLKLAKNLTTWARYCAVNDQDARGFLERLRFLRRHSPFEVHATLWRLARQAVAEGLDTPGLVIRLLQAAAILEGPKRVKPSKQLDQTAE